ncbi:hypothetical protein [Salsipaludibacter albus]|uniref:hypothetical protein n=1 Tax=Salsipaludibacter albus TaxID=2849650 RepID=UPI001EE4035A|nr:hypothetical protein [Salsipaludibacter albus]MBY5161606.1 hypothetical protein [Salsipaludibacter albus]
MPATRDDASSSEGSRQAPTGGSDEAVGRPLLPSMRILLLVAAVLVFLAGIQLFVFSERTDRYFAWTIEPSLTAAFLGASYWASAAFELSAGRRRQWHRARIAVPTVFVFTSLTLVVTLVHLDRFHLDAELELATRAVTWAWIVVYAVVPVLMVVVWWRQARVPGGDPPRVAPLGRGLRALVVVQAAVLAGTGMPLLVAPTWALPAWPWELTPLTARAIGAWLTSLAVAALHALVEDDLDRLRPAGWAWTVFALLQAVALLRYPTTPDWNRPSSWTYLVFLLSALVVGAAALRGSRAGGVRPGAS